MLILIFLGWGRFPGMLRGWFYTVCREYGRVNLETSTRGLQETESAHFRVRCQPSDSDVADMVLEAAERVYEPINDALGFRPQGKVLIVIYPTSLELGKSFGWPADQSALGVYWMGTIRVLSPKAWITDESDFDERFWAAGPIAHEYTHFVVDHLTRGNYPRWLTEGLAQREDRDLTGFVFNVDGENLAEQKPYRLDQLDSDFDDRPDQMLAYWQSLAAVEFMDEHYSIDRIKDLINLLGRGYNQEVAFRATFGISFDEFEAGYQFWLQKYIPTTDPLEQVAATEGSI
ncbi:MAG: hypothetical protein HPY50_14290 [Firmicutes bacterium]|nr:hypothetical protein [Bacillota bacterium]